MLCCYSDMALVRLDKRKQACVQVSILCGDITQYYGACQAGQKARHPSLPPGTQRFLRLGSPRANNCFKGRTNPGRTSPPSKESSSRRVRNFVGEVYTRAVRFL